MTDASAPPLPGLKDRVLGLTVALSVIGYVLVVGTLYVGLPIYPDLDLGTVNALSHSIAVVNALATTSLVLGWRAIRHGDVDKHRKLMGTAFALIIVFLVLYLLKTGGGGTKEIALDPGVVYYAYLAMLAVHVLLSVVSVPVVLYALLLGLTHTPRELRADTPHRRVGRVAASAWIVSLTLGIVTYALLNWVYDYEFAQAAIAIPI